MPNKPDKPLTDRQKLFVDYLPAYNWDKTKAALAAGFSPTYANTRIHSLVKANIGLSRAIESKRQDISAESQDLREKVQKKLLEIGFNPKTSESNVIKALGEVSKMNGWQSTTINHESGQRQRELDAAREAEVKRLLDSRFGVKAIESTIKPPESPPGGQMDDDMEAGSVAGLGLSGPNDSLTLGKTVFSGDNEANSEDVPPILDEKQG